jgi:hypothetical protein
VPWREPQISPLRSFRAPVEMTKGRAALPGRISCRTGVAQEETAEPQVPPLRCAPVGMTRGEGWLRLESLREETADAIIALYKT